MSGSFSLFDTTGDSELWGPITSTPIEDVNMGASGTPSIASTSSGTCSGTTVTEGNSAKVYAKESGRKQYGEYTQS